MRWLFAFPALVLLANSPRLPEGPPRATVMRPALVVFTGGGLPRRHHMTNGGKIHQFMTSLEVTAGRDVADARRIAVALYWHDKVWAEFVRDTILIESLPLPTEKGVPGRPRTRAAVDSGWAESAHLYLLANGKALLQCDSCVLFDGFREIGPIGLLILREAGLPISNSSGK
jgi:hypothetical protein